MSAAAWLFLAAAIVAEVAGTLCLQLAVQQRKAWYAVVLGAYVAAFTLMSQALGAGMPLGIAYGVLAAAGVALNDIFSKIFIVTTLLQVLLMDIALVGGVVY